MKPRWITRNILTLLLQKDMPDALPFAEKQKSWLSIWLPLYYLLQREVE
jgi:hypothetical protein